MNYSREHLQDFFKNNMALAIEHFENDHDHQERAHQYAMRTQEIGYITFKRFFGGRRYYWVENGVSEELEALECFLKGRNITPCLKTTKDKSSSKS